MFLYIVFFVSKVLLGVVRQKKETFNCGSAFSVPYCVTNRVELPEQLPVLFVKALNTNTVVVIPWNRVCHSHLLRYVWDDKSGIMRWSPGPEKILYDVK